MIKKIIYSLLTLCIFLFITFWGIKLMGDPKPSSGTKEYLKLHGYVEGQINEIRVGGVLLRFPAGVKFSPETVKNILKGNADSVVSSFNYKPMVEGSSNLNMVRVEFWPYIEGTYSFWEDQINKKKWKSITPIDDIGLVEYLEDSNEGAWGSTTYVSMKGEGGNDVLIYSCTKSGSRVSQCRTRYNKNNKIFINYYFNGENIKDWKLIHNEFIKYINSIIIEE